jgi:hypothetical protein
MNHENELPAYGQKRSLVMLSQTVNAGRKRAQRAFPMTDASCCESCESRKTLNRHHMDGDTSNNRDENIQILCACCHGRLHANQRWARRRDS